MSNKNQFVDAPPADVIGTAAKLAEILHSDPSALDENAINMGEELLAIFNDAEFGETPETAPFKKQINNQKLEIIQQAIDDLAGRGKMLVNCYMGVLFAGKRTSTFICQYAEMPEGQVIFSIELQDPIVFTEWRKGAKDKITEENVNAAIYRLALEWSKLL